MINDKIIARAKVKRLFNTEGASVLRNEAVDCFAEEITKYARLVAQNACRLMKHADRTTLYKKDIEEAVEMMKSIIASM